MLSSLAPLVLLACPIGMGLMMWFMGRGTKSSEGPGPHSVADLQAERRALDGEIARLEAEERVREDLVAGRS